MAAVTPGPGGDFMLGYPSIRPIRSGMAVGSLVAGVASLLAALVACGFGLVGGPEVTGAFTLLGCLAGAGGGAVGFLALRQVSRSTGELAGRGLALSGLICSGVGFAWAVASLGLAIVLPAT
ncbi:hypothetical protein [Longispora albida]|uniref:hypothetical protein n=1 Tax=Longispora albida TaxID=203523 RepID=UPI0003766AA1|nr:hypothetical protein [Longispora albida]